DLQQHHGSLLSERTPLDWVVGTDAATGEKTLVPRASVGIDYQVSEAWQPPLLHGSTNGLCAAMLGRIADAGAWIEIADVPNRWGLPCFVTYLWSEDFPALAVSSGVHSSPAVALSRAVTESAQSRLTAIAGSRDDLSAALFSPAPSAAGRAPVTQGDVVGWADVSAPVHQFAEDTDETRWLADRVCELTGSPPVVVDLSTHDGFSVVKVVAAGVTFDGRHEIPRPLAPPASPPAPKESA
ncbi:hypothetical protein XF35_38650, partial [Streptomyces platensis subsp. clarensis]|nr:hypothetical protein [Streptomyces platensis subsp. clarensis]